MGFRPHDANSPQRPITPEPHQGKQSFRAGMLHRLHNLFSRDDPPGSHVHCPEDISWPDQPPPQSKRDWATRPVGVGLPRQATFQRQNSEKRERLCPVSPGNQGRRAVSHSRQVSLSLPRRRANSTPPPCNPARTSAPAVAVTARANDSNQHDEDFPPSATPDQPLMLTDQGIEETQRPPRPPSITSSIESHDEHFPNTDNKAEINAELDTRWILNLSMHFRDKSDREKFFVTYAQTPSKWRRVTVSCDYRNAEPGSLEMDLKELQFQRDKSLQIYESIRDSLPEIQFYDTVTNLKLETSDGRLHVHVTEDVNEIIPYPPRSTVAHLFEDDQYRPQEIRESDLTFDSHLSGFVYKVTHESKTFIKKEIPGPDTVDEFLYEINALHALHESSRVIRLEAIIVDDTHQLVKGLLITYAERGAIVDILYDHRGKVPLEERLTWGRDAVIGLSDIHEEGYVQGDFTLSNIVVDDEGNAKIIDINRRGCPVGWEPPEIRTKIASHQRISMYIGEKSDLFQLGMTLWGLAADDDEPERHDPPLSVDQLPDEVPLWYKEIVTICLSDRPRDRHSAKELARMFPSDVAGLINSMPGCKPELGLRTQKRYIDPSQAVEREDIDRFKNGYLDDEMLPYSPQSSRDDPTFTYPRSSEYDHGSDISAFERPRGRRPPTNLEHLNNRERRAWSPDERPSPSFDDNEANIVEIVPGRRAQYEEIDFEGKPFLIARNTFSDDELRILERNDVFENVLRGAEHSSLDDRATETAEVSETNLQGNARPVLPSRTTSSSTPRNSAAVLPHLSEQQLAELNGEMRSSGLVELGAHSSPTTLIAQIPEHLSTLHERQGSISPQPPPSLSYADSGFHEPDSFDEDEAGQETQEGARVPETFANDAPIESSCTPIPHSPDNDKQVIKQPVDAGATATISPPPLLRYDTSIRITDPVVTDVTLSEAVADEKVMDPPTGESSPAAPELHPIIHNPMDPEASSVALTSNG